MFSRAHFKNCLKNCLTFVFQFNIMGKSVIVKEKIMQKFAIDFLSKLKYDTYMMNLN